MDWALLAGVPGDDVQRLLQIARRRTFRRGEVVFHMGDPADTLHLVVSGRFAVRVQTALADVAVLTILGPGDLFGELALLESDGRRSATVEAIEAGETRSIHRPDFEALRDRHPSVTDVVTAILAEQVRRLTGNLLEALYLPADRRIRRRVAELADAYAPDGGEVTIPLRQEDLAGLAGTSRATVNRVLREEEARGTVRLARGRTTVLDREGLARRGR
ncbi:MAG TPA: Crp/Fnr family transcriptional regulator [Miltoncostaeaceae bacterium]|nr:Crp/Fnr family transcriptional regulator [Miltoncostaeaceae bacterium]